MEAGTIKTSPAELSQVELVEDFLCFHYGVTLRGVAFRFGGLCWSPAFRRSFGRMDLWVFNAAYASGSSGAAAYAYDGGKDTVFSYDRRGEHRYLTYWLGFFRGLVRV